MNSWEKFKKYALNSGLVCKGDRILLAVSGGPDSVAMLHMLWRLKKTVPLELAVIHFDHGLRRAAKKESEYVAKLSRKFGLPVILKKIHVKEFALRNKVSLEAAGRNLRYDILAKEAQDLQFDKIATGHTADDNAETVIMWIMRGTGTDGLKGIPGERKLSNGIIIIRPILTLTKDEILAYLKSQRLVYFTDKSNFRFDFTRNKIRHKIVRELKKYNKKFIEHVSNLSRIVSDESDLLDKLSDKAAKRAVKCKKNRILLDLDKFFLYNKTIQSRIIKNILPVRISSHSIEKALVFLLDPRKKHLILSPYWAIMKKYGKAFIYKTDNYER